MGYTPLFESLTEGSLCGRWPDIGLWPVLLSMADWRGHIDKTPHYISMVTGLPQAEVLGCIGRFCAPDPDSRSRAESGARLVLIDPERSWGWQVVNIQIYRDRASGHDQVLDGRNAAKVRRYKQRIKDTEGHRETPSNTHSYSNTDSYTDKKNISVAPLPKQKHANEFAIFKTIYPKRSGSQPWNKAYKALSARLDGGVVWGEIEAGALRYANWCRETGKVGTEFVMQAARFLGPEQQFLLAWEPPASKADVRLAGNLSAAEEFMQRTEATA